MNCCCCCCWNISCCCCCNCCCCSFICCCILSNCFCLLSSCFCLSSSCFSLSSSCLWTSLCANSLDSLSLVEEVHTPYLARGPLVSCRWHWTSSQPKQSCHWSEPPWMSRVSPACQRSGHCCHFVHTSCPALTQYWRFS